MWRADVCNSISLKRTEKAMKRGRRNKMSGAFFFSDPWPLRKCFHVLCLSRLRAKKENILSSKPHATDSFWSQINQPCVSDHVTLFVLCAIPNISCFNSPRTPIPILSHTHCTYTRIHIHTTHAHSDFPFPVRKITWTGRMACFNATCSGRKTGRGVQGCPTWNAHRVRGNPELMAALQLLNTVSKVSLEHFFFCFSTAIMRSAFACAKMLVLKICLFSDNKFQYKLTDQAA